MGSSESKEHKIPKSVYESRYKRSNFSQTPEEPKITNNRMKTNHQQQNLRNANISSHGHVYKRPAPSASHVPTVDQQQTAINANLPSIPCSSGQSYTVNHPPSTVEEDIQRQINRLNNLTRNINDDPFNEIPVSNRNVVRETPMKPVKQKPVCKPPIRLNDLEEFMTFWNIWKEQFIAFVTVMDEDRQKYNEWGSFFLNFMGPVSQQILNHLFFDKEEDKKDYTILIKKYNSFYEFNKATKGCYETAAEYIERLKKEAAPNIRNLDETLKEKLARDIQKLHKERFTALASSRIPHFRFETTFKSLSIAEIGFIWKNCEESNSNVVENINCNKCGRIHPKDKCPALGKECNRCKKRDHFAKYCSELMYVTNCSFCGGNHGYKKCPAYGEKCSKCSKLHHFSWKCSKEFMVRNCRFCNIIHPMDRNKCPAKNSFCAICKTRGHFEMKCNGKKKL